MLSRKVVRRKKIKMRIRKRIAGVASRPRLSIFRSNKDIYAQLIDDEQGHTIASASSRMLSGEDCNLKKVDKAKKVGALLAGTAANSGIEEVVFDRGGYLYHGRVKALAEGAREGGLKF
jgi:large subunit ribosomal protein L18